MTDIKIVFTSEELDALCRMIGTLWREDEAERRLVQKIVAAAAFAAATDG